MLNFNVDPYFDDFDPNNNYHRILFRPGRAVQARELTQSQTILQDQISKFADHIFKQNTPVKGGQTTINTRAVYLKLNATYNDNDIVAADFLNQVITDSTGVIFAKVIATEETTGGDPPTLILTYLSGKQFAAGDLIFSNSSSTVAQIVATNHTGFAATASVSEGVFYIVNGYSYSDVQNPDGTYSRYSIGNFVSLQPQTIIVQKYGNTPTKRVGLTISEYVSDYVTDPALLDPAVGATNYQAPGADRYTITLTLDTKPIELGSDSSFIELVRVTNGKIQRMVDGTVYGVIDDYFAKRTYDTNGDFIVSDFKVIPKANTTDSSTYQLQIGTGSAYVRGYRVENTIDKVLETTRARTTQAINNNTVSIDYGSYLYTNNIKLPFDITKVIPVDFHCVNAASSIITTNAITYNATKVASGYLRAMSYDTNSSDANTQTYIYKSYVSDLQNYVLSGVASSGTSSNVVFTDTTDKFSAVANAYYGAAITIDSGSSSGDVRKVISYNGTTKTATVDSPFTIPITSSSNFSLRFATRDIDLMVAPDATGYAYTAYAGIDPKGKVNNLSIGDTVLYNAQSPELIFNLGAPYVSNITDASYSSFRVFRGVSFTTTTGGVTAQCTLTNTSFFGTGGTTQSADVAKNYYTIFDASGNIINFTGSNTITLDAGKGIATLFVSGGSTFTGTVIAKIAVNNADSTSTALKIKSLITANNTGVNITGTNVGGVKVDLVEAQVYIPSAYIAAAGAKQSLYISDVKRIVKIIDTGNPSTAPTNAMLTNTSYDVTSNYVFNNGQNDSYYGFASIKLKPGANKAVGNLLVLVDYYSHTGGDGYFSVNSYRASGDGGVSPKPETYSEIPSYTSKNGTVYQARDCIDFRLSVVNAQATEEFRYSTPITTTNSSGAYLPIDLSTYTNDYTYYLGRKDILVLSKDRSFEIIKGKPSVLPTLPSTPQGSLLMANLVLDPYTAYLPGENVNGGLPNLSLEKIQHKRWQMSDISDLQTRINNIEYYTSLSLLEKQAESLLVYDNNGLNRFKNGILVDNFTSFATADTGNADFSSKINKRETLLTSTDHVTNFPLQAKSVMKSLGNLSDASQATNSFKYHSVTGGVTSIFTLPYTSANLVVQKLASNTVSLNPFAVSIDGGSLDINPPMDMWVSTSKDPDILLVDPNLTISKQGKTLNTLSATDWQTISGTQHSTTTQSGSTVTVSTYTSQSQQVTSGYYDKVDSLNSTFITDISVQPYIRSQNLIVRAKGMKINTPISAYFDGTKVNDYIIQPNIVELTGVYGNFAEGDVVGYYSSGTFTPTARVVSVTKLSSTKVRLYLTSDNSSTVYTTNNILQNVKYDSSGVYVSNTAFGTLSSSASQVISLSGSAGWVSGGANTALKGGGTYSVGVTSVNLGTKASATTDFYVGSTVVVKTFNQKKTTKDVVVGQTWVDSGEWSPWTLVDVVESRDFYTTAEEKYTATISAYNGTTKVATLSTAINISMGSNTPVTGGDKGIPTNIQSTYSINGTTYLVSQATTQTKVPALSTDEYGNFAGIFAIPSNTFRTGDRILRIDNRTVDGDPASATTFAEGIFTASGLAARSQTLNFGASVSAAGKATVFTAQAQKDNVLINEYSYNIDPIAQSFIIDKTTYPNGAFIKSIKVFFKGKPSGTSVPVKLFVTDTTNGYPNGMALDHSVVVKSSQDIIVSNNPQHLDSSTYTEFVFEAPVYIRSGNLYAFILQTTSPDYTVWIAAQNAIAVSSSVKNLPSDATPTTLTKIGGSPYVGGLFESQNGITWSADQTKNMMFLIDNCVFNTAATPTIQYVVPKKLPVRKLVANDLDYFKDANTVTNIDGVFYSRDLRSDAYNITTTDFTPTGTGITYTYTPTLQSTYVADATKDVSPGKYATSMPTHIYLDDGKGPRVLDSNSASSFTLNASLTTNDQYVSPVISDDGLSLYNIKYNINNMGISNNNIILTKSNVIYSSIPTVTISAPTGLGGSQAYAAANVTSSGIIDFINVITTGSGYIQTPTITIAANTGAEADTATIEGETSATGGNGWSRYITKKVVLTPENDSGDLRVYVSAYKPLGSNIFVYYKILNRNDTQLFDDQNWILATELGQTVYSLGRDDYREYVFAPGTAGSADNTVSYTSSNGTTYNNFSQFAIKIVMATSDTTKTPIIQDLRVLALPSSGA